jgi:hypothetical protein
MLLMIVLNSSIHDVKVGKDNTIMVAYKAGTIGIYRIDYVNKELRDCLTLGAWYSIMILQRA